MTDDEKKETKVCKCGELGRFCTQVASIFFGVLLAILVSAAILKPQMPCHKGMPPMGGMPGVERPMTPPSAQWQGQPPIGPEFRGHHKDFKKGDFKSHRPDFQPPMPPEAKPAK